MFNISLRPRQISIKRGPVLNQKNKYPMNSGRFKRSPMDRVIGNVFQLIIIFLPNSLPLFTLHCQHLPSVHIIVHFPALLLRLSDQPRITHFSRKLGNINHRLTPGAVRWRCDSRKPRNESQHGQTFWKIVSQFDD